ncbi:PSME3-interacting protein-like [Etheostoma spectabile]|uniref:PSME3-interacting protein-like n=1 Tax=Etheostoma spectabile TaxID=54343 RepID=UPI0013AEFFA3|nr:PSME3-interacting protein-like [Etheostoma spectabile]
MEQEENQGELKIKNNPQPDSQGPPSCPGLRSRRVTPAVSGRVRRRFTRTLGYSGSSDSDSSSDSEGSVDAIMLPYPRHSRAYR